MVVGQDFKIGRTKGAPNEALQPGDTLLSGQYRIDSYLSAGGFGVTYLATDSLDRKVVIKECYPNSMCSRSDGRVHARTQSQQEEFKAVVRNFREEALRMAKLKHPNIVGVHQVFEDNSTAYMALDFIRGRDLLEIVEQERDILTPAEIKRILLQLLDAISYIHERDILHRDISPDNILLDEAGQPVLIDFGAAREVATRASRALSALHVVKDGYSPQEFYLSNGVQTASSDLYSLAATFYHLIMGSAPPNSQVRLAALAAEEVDPYVEIPPRTPGYDHYFIGAINKALAVFPKHRLQSAVEWIEQIDQLRRQTAMREGARKDKAIEMSIRQLTEECNNALEAEDRAKPQRKAELVPRAKPRSAVVPKPRVAGAPEAIRRVAPSIGHIHSAHDTSNHDEVVIDSRKIPRRRSLLSRMLHNSIWLVTIGRYRGNAKNGGLDQ